MARLLGISLVSAAALGLEVLLMRLLSIVQWHHFAYMVISLALLGFGASGSFLTLARGVVLRRPRAALTANAAVLAVAAPGAFLLAQRLPFNPLELAWDARQWGYAAALYLILAVPFFAAANCIGIAFMAAPGSIHRTYRYDLTGAGLGALAVVGALFVWHPVTCLLVLGSAAWLAAALFALPARGGAGWRAGCPALSLALVAAVQPWLWPGDWTRLRLSEYKGLAQALAVQGARVDKEVWGPLGLVDVVDSPVIPLRLAPGLSLNATTEPPSQLGLFVDGEGPSAITRFDGELAPLAYLDYLPSALPYHLLESPRVLVVGSGGGAQVLQARYHRAERIDAVELNGQVVHLLRGPYADFSGHLYGRPDTRVHVAEARHFLTRERQRYDLIQVALVDSFGATAGGVHALAESYLYTVEAFSVALDRLAPGGLLAITRWVRLPPRDGLKAFATAVAALERRGVARPSEHLALIRGWRTATLLVAERPLDAASIERIKGFCVGRSFDLAWYPGMAEAEANRFNRWAAPYLHRGARALLGPNREAFLADYKFHVAPATDDRPYFFRFFAWRSLPELLAKARVGGLPLVEWGYLVLVATLVQALLASLVLILLPLWGRRRALAAAGRGRLLGYFAALGLAFLFVEMAFMQRLILFLGHPVYAVAAVLGAFLVFAGVGSGLAPRLAAALPDGRSPVRVAVAGIVLVAGGYLLLLPAALPALIALPDAARWALAVALLAPLGVLMGMPFPLGLAAFGRRAPEAVPWAWAVNGCASVVSAVLATLLAIHLGFTAVVSLALVLYLAAATVFAPR